MIYLHVIEVYLKVAIAMFCFSHLKNPSNIMKTFFNFIWGLQLLKKQPVITIRIYVLHKITIALKFMSYINSDFQIPAKKLQTPG